MVDLQAELKVAMKNKEKRRTAILKDVIGEAKNLAIQDKRKEINDKDTEAALNKIRKIYQDQIDTCPADREDKLNEYKENLEILMVYFPRQLSKDEVRTKIRELMEGKEAKNLGDVMKVVMPELKGKAEGKVINTIAKEFVNSTY